MTKWKLSQLLFGKNRPIELYKLLGQTLDQSSEESRQLVFVNAVEREDGSGSKFNMTISFVLSGETVRVFIRTID